VVVCRAITLRRLDRRTRRVMIASGQVSSMPKIATVDQERLVIVGATGMVGGYALRCALKNPCRRKCDCYRAQEARHLAPQADGGSRLRRLPRSALHHGREPHAPTKAEYIRADQPVTFRLVRDSTRFRTCSTRSTLAGRFGSGLRFFRDGRSRVVAASCARTRRLLFVHLPQNLMNKVGSPTV
jgi:hypothetical protein